METAPPGRFLVGAGLLVWGAAVLAQAAAWTSGTAPLGRRAVVSAVAYGVFAIAFRLASATIRRSVWPRAALAVQTVAALTALALGDTRFEGALLCVVAGQTPLVIGEKEGLVWVIAQTAAMGAVDIVTPYHSRSGLISAVAYAGFQLFAFGAARLAAREARGRAELARVHAELLATRELFADSTRTAERLRIARELHDALGHYLTALSLQLEVARNVADGGAKEPVDRAHAVTKKLLAELRAVVSAMRGDAPLDLSRALRTLVAGIPHPRVHLEVEDNFRVEAALAHTIFRCVQEALTNAVRHARADNVHLAIATTGEIVTVTAKDDGCGATAMQAGHGLSGLRQRIEEMGGKVEIEAEKGAGLTLRALLPVRAGAS